MFNGFRSLSQIAEEVIAEWRTSATGQPIYFNIMESTATTPQIDKVAKLLLNAWSAEYALRIRPLISDQSEMDTSVDWIFPQAYFAFLFSVRAVLAVDGILVANPESIEKLVTRWVANGRYGNGIFNNNNPLVELMQHRPSTSKKPVRLTKAEFASLQQKLIQKIYAVSIIHETYILNRLGDEAYQQLINSLPSYLKDAFVGARATFLLTNN